MRVIVLKLGGSVLAGEASLARAAHEVYRWRRDGYAVCVVASAFAGETDRLLAAAAAGGAGPHAVAATAATGEARAAALLSGTLDRAGVPCRVLTPAALAMRALGDPLEAAPVALDRSRLDAALLEDGVAVVPGFAAVDEAGRTVLLGRGGSDLSALFLAHALGARCRLVKDVDGLYERDPAAPGPRPRRYAAATWADALATDGTVLQRRAVAFARERGLAFEVAGVNGVTPTLVGAGPTRSTAPSDRAGAAHGGRACDLGDAPEGDGAVAAPPPRPLRVALLGLGTVGGGVLALARELPDLLDVCVAASRDPDGGAARTLPAGVWCGDPVLAAGSAGIDVVVECLGGLEPARAALLAALARGADVVTANKRVLAVHGDELRCAARASGARLVASASVGGSAPILERAAACAGELRALRAVLNGTVNYVLERASFGARVDDALAEARAFGLAERDASRDLDGSDAADKLCVIAAALAEASGAWAPLRPADVAREPLDAAVVRRARDAAASGRRLRQVATLALTARGAQAAVRFVEVAPGDALFALPGASNAAVLLDARGPLEHVRGGGAGRWPTAESVLGDLLALARARVRCGAGQGGAAPGRRRSNSTCVGAPAWTSTTVRPRTTGA